MAEPNLVPRTNKGASIGTALKQWAHGFFGDLTIDGNKPLVDANNLGDVDDPAAAVVNLGLAYNLAATHATLDYTLRTTADGGTVDGPTAPVATEIATLMSIES